MSHNICHTNLILQITQLLIKQQSRAPLRLIRLTITYISDQSPVFHRTMTEFMHSKKITFRQHVFDIEYFAEMIDDLNSIVKSELTLLDKSFCCVDADGDSFAVISCSLGECFDVLEFTDGIGKELPSKSSEEGLRRLT